MNRQPPHPDPPDDADERYRRASALDPSRPSEGARHSVLAHAAQLAAERARYARMRARHWRPALFGTLAAAALAGLVVAPRYFLPGAPTTPPAAAPRVAATSAAATSSPAAAESAPAAPAAVASASSVAASQGPQPELRAGRHAERDVRADYLAAREAATARTAPPPEEPASPPQSGASRAQGLNGFIGGMPGRQPKVSDAAAEADAGEALRRAAESGDAPALRRLLAGQTNIQAYSSDLRTAPQPVDINARDPEGRTALLRATLHNQQETVLTLLVSGADPNIADARGITPLQAARAGGYGAIAETLQRYGAR